MRISVVLCAAVGVQQAISGPVHLQVLDHGPKVISAMNTTNTSTATTVKPVHRRFFFNPFAHLFELTPSRAADKPLGPEVSDKKVVASTPTPTVSFLAPFPSVTPVRNVTAPASSEQQIGQNNKAQTPGWGKRLKNWFAGLAPHLLPGLLTPSNSTSVPSQAPSPTTDFLPIYTRTGGALLAAKKAFQTSLSKAPLRKGYDAVISQPALSSNASTAALLFQPIMDFKINSCYNAVAVSKDGNLNPGMRAEWASLAADCRNPISLTPEYNNVYVRRRCNHGWCAWMYDYYFPKDVMSEGGLFLAGHRHEWEFVVVWTNIKSTAKENERIFTDSNTLEWKDVSTQDGDLRDSLPADRIPRLEDWTPEHVSFSYHTGASDFNYNDIVWHNGTHPRVIYTKQGLVTHIIRPAQLYDWTIWNDSKGYIRGPLVEWDGLPTPEIRSKMVKPGAWGAASPSIGPDGQFARKLLRAMPDAVRDDGFDTTYDVYDKLPQYAEPF